VSGTPLVATPVYGLRTWTISGQRPEERLAGPQRETPWPPGGAWLEASCPAAKGHSAPAPDCDCGVHGWHPRPRAARQILASRREIPGIVEARGAIEVHEEGFRAERARPYAFFLTPGRNAALAHRLGEAYDVPVVEVGDADAVLAWCSEGGLGLSPAVVAGLLGTDELDAQRRARRSRVRANAFRLAAAIIVAALLVAAGVAVTDSPGDRELRGRVGEVRGR
jgi:hypothetical protein